MCGFGILSVPAHARTDSITHLLTLDEPASYMIYNNGVSLNALWESIKMVENGAN